jgi:hypothetical protein
LVSGAPGEEHCEAFRLPGKSFSTTIPEINLAALRAQASVLRLEIFSGNSLADFSSSRSFMLHRKASRSSSGAGTE